MSVRLETREFTHFHLFCGLGGGARGFNRSTARVGMREGRFRCLGGIDVDPKAIRNFTRLAGVSGTVMDLFSRLQYIAFHGREPPADWREATPADIRRAAGNERPNAVFLSAPCKGFSGLLSQATSLTMKYQALNELTLRGIWLMLEAWADDPPELVIFENVPRIATRGRALLDQIVALLRHYGYMVAETVHDCGEIGGLAQSRKRFLLVARHAQKVPNFLYEPTKHRLRGVGEILDMMPLPGDPAGGPMHRVPSLQWKTWVRLAFVEAGSDWRSLNKLTVEDGQLKDYLIVHEYRAGFMGVNRWEEPTGTVAGRSTPTNGAFSIADMRPPHNAAEYSQYGVMRYEDTAGTVTSQAAPGGGYFSIADPRANELRTAAYGVQAWAERSGAVIGESFPTNGAFAVADPRPMQDTADLQGNWHVNGYDAHSRAVVGNRKSGAAAVADPRLNHSDGTHTNKYRIVPWDRSAGSVIGSDRVGSGAPCVADPRPSEREDYKQTKYRVTAMEEVAGTVIAASTTGNGAFAVADPRPDCLKEGRAYQTQGHYGVVPYDQSTGAVPAFAKNNNGAWSVADPRADAIILPQAGDRLTCIIRALDGTWHRPFTTLELAALQSLIDVEDPATWAPFAASDSDSREQIGNAVPPYGATGMGDTFLKTLLLAEAGETFSLSSVPIWVRPLAVALAVDTSQVPV